MQIWRFFQRLRYISGSVLAVSLCATIYYRFLPLRWATGADEVILSSVPQPLSSQSQYCEDRFGLSYLINFRNASAEYCDPMSTSTLACFSSTIDPHGSRKDSFCITGPAFFDPVHKNFNLNCNLRSITTPQIESGVQPFNLFPTYWYATGPHIVATQYLHLSPDVQGTPLLPGARLPILILVKREETIFNMWHSLMDIMSTKLTIQVLRMATDPSTEPPYFEPAAIDNVQILILDNHPPGPFYQLWNQFSSKPIRTLSELNNMAEVPPSRIILPLPGGSNPFWQGDWEVLPCSSSSFLQAFAKQIIAFNRVSIPARIPTQSVVITYILRTKNRRLVNEDDMLTALRLRNPDVIINAVDFAVHPFAEQLVITGSTDILLGVHGAGLTHGMFLPPKSVIVEIMPYNLKHKGFLNMARMLGHDYFSARSADRPEITNAKGDFHFDDVYLQEPEFLQVVEEAIHTVRKLRSK